MVFSLSGTGRDASSATLANSSLAAFDKNVTPPADGPTPATTPHATQQPPAKTAEARVRQQYLQTQPAVTKEVPATFLPGSDSATPGYEPGTIQDGLQPLLPRYDLPKEEQTRQHNAFIAHVARIWHTLPTTLAIKARFEAAPRISKEALSPGCVLEKLKCLGEELEHVTEGRTLRVQMQENLEGIENNQGNTSTMHNAVWIKAKGSYDDTDIGYEIAEARGSTARRVQKSWVQPGIYMVHEPLNTRLGENASFFAQRWSGNIPYSTSMRGTVARPHRRFVEMTEKARKDIHFAIKNRFNPKPPFAMNPPPAGYFESIDNKPRDPGDVCSSFIVRLFQAAYGNIRLEDATRNMSEAEALEKADAMLNDPAFLEEEWLRCQPEGVSPGGLSHKFYTATDREGNQQFRELGVLIIRPEDVLHPEPAFARDGTRLRYLSPNAPRQAPRLASRL